MGRRRCSEWSKINKEIEYKLKRTCIYCSVNQKTLLNLRKHENVCKAAVEPKKALPDKVRKAKEVLAKPTKVQRRAKESLLKKATSKDNINHSSTLQFHEILS